MIEKQTLNKNRVEQRFQRSIQSYNHHAVIQKMVCTKLVEILAQTCGQNFTQALEIGAGTGFCTQKLLSSCKVEQLYLNDIVPSMEDTLIQLCSTSPLTNVHFVMGDAETIPLPDQNNLIISTSTIQWFNDIHTFIEHCKTKLAQHGVLALSTFGQDNLYEIAKITGTSLKYPALETWKEMLNNSFELITLFDEKVSVYFNTPRLVLSHLKYTGVNGIEVAQWTKKDMLRFARAYELFYEAWIGYRLTYHPMYMICKLK